jgi:hypothetical protein
MPDPSPPHQPLPPFTLQRRSPVPGINLLLLRKLSLLFWWRLCVAPRLVPDMDGGKINSHARDKYQFETTNANIYNCRPARDIPSPGFNVEKNQSNVQPLVNPRKNDMDESYVTCKLNVMTYSDKRLAVSLERLVVKSSTR